ncbi:MAG: polysaccharide biosynthesis tyrosine autokinase [Deltaproteobacteria bacterium]
MNLKTEKNYYEILNITPDATQEEIEQAYRKAFQAYNDDSLAAYSLYSSGGKRAMVEKISEVYETLKDPGKKTEYDSRLAGADKKDGRTAGEFIVFDEAPELEGFDNTVNFKKPIVVMEETDPVAAEQYRVLYTRLNQIKQKESLSAFAVTSAVKGEGKTVLSLNLSYVIAEEFKKRCILVECDFKKPSVSSYFASKGPEYGLVDVLRGEAELSDAVTRLEGSDNLFFLRAGKNVKNSSELLGSEKMEEVMDELKKGFDFLIIDCPPILPLADMNIISRLVDGLVMVIRAESTPKNMVRAAMDSIKEGRFFGIVLNAAHTSLEKYYY